MSSYSSTRRARRHLARSPERTVPALRDGDVGTLQLLRHARAAGAVARGRRRDCEPRFRLDAGRSAQAVRSLHRLRLLHAADRRLARRQLPRPAQVRDHRRPGDGRGPVHAGGRDSGQPAALLHRPDPARPRQRLLQAEHLDDGRRPVPRRRRASRRRVHDLLHGHQRGRVPGAAHLLDARRRPGQGLGVRLLRRRRRHDPVRHHPAAARAQVPGRDRRRAGRAPGCRARGRREKAADAGRSRSPARDLHAVRVHRAVLGRVRAGRRPHEPVRRGEDRSHDRLRSKCRRAGSSR